MVTSVMIDLDLTEDGNLQSCFVRDCAGRKIDLVGLHNGPHPLQIIPSRWRALAKSLELFVDELASVESSVEPNGDLITGLFRQLIYDATELFESYALLVPKRVATKIKVEKTAFADFKLTSKRLRDPCAHLCNRCKHQGAQIRFLWAKSPTNARTGSRILVTTYSGGDGLIRDDTVHKGAMAGIGLVRWAHELTHNLLRIDRAASILINQLSDGEFIAMPTISPIIANGGSMRKLASIRATRYADEPSRHDGIEFSNSVVSLVRVSADDFGLTANVTTKLTIEGGTTRYSVA